MDMAEPQVPATGSGDGVTPDPAAPVTPPPTPPAADPVTPDPAPADDLEALKLKAAKYDTAVSESIAERQKRQAAEAKVAEFEKANETAQETLTREKAEADERAEKAEAKVKEMAVTTAVRGAASDLKFVKPAQAQALIDTSKLDADSATFEQDVEKLVKELADENPHLLGTASGGGSSAGNGDSRGGKQLTAADLQRMTRAEKAALSSEERLAALART